MKKIVFSTVGFMLIGMCAVQAQEYDTTGRADRQQNDQRYEQSRQQDNQSQQQRDQAWQQQSDRSQNQDAYANEGMVIIEKDEIPSSLKETLKEDKYSGWENATIYHNTNTGEYVIAPRAYRFDGQGKEIEMGNLGYGSRDGQSRYSNDPYPDRTRESQDGQRQARDQMGEIPTSASEQDQADQSPQSQRTYDQSSQGQQQSDQSEYDQSQQRQRDQSSSYRTDQDNTSERSAQRQYRPENMVEVQAEQVPASLRRTLSETQYSGWEENGKLYQDPSTSEYILVMKKTDDSSQPQTYRFDRNGKVQEDQNESGQRNEGQ